MLDDQNESMRDSSVLYSSEGEQGNQVRIEKREDGFYACVSNGENPDTKVVFERTKIPDDIISNFKCESMDAWLRFHFWPNKKPRLQAVCSEKDVRAFISAHSDLSKNARKKVEREVTEIDYRHAKEKIRYYHRRKIVLIVFSVLLIPVLLIGILETCKSGLTEDEISILPFVVLFGLFIIGACVYAVFTEKNAKREIQRYELNQKADMEESAKHEIRHNEKQLVHLYKKEVDHLHRLGSVRFIPLQMLQGESEYYAIDDRDGQPYYVIDAPVGQTGSKSVREISKTRITYDDVRKDLSPVRFEGLNEENWKNFLHHK